MRNRTAELPNRELIEKTTPKASITMKIACLGWGSLVWDPGELPVRGKWQTNGPFLPIEFVRQSQDGRITLVITDGAVGIPVLWAALESTSLHDGREALAKREKVKTKNFERSIAAWSSDFSTNHTEVEPVAAWAKEVGIDGVVWTSLKPRFSNVLRTASCEEVLRYLANLTGEAKVRAEKYIRRAPSQIRTSYRGEIERRLGWTPLVLTT